MKIASSMTIDLNNINSLKLWIEYMPECFINNLDNEEYNDNLLEGRVILNKINKLYKLIEEITNKEVDVTDNHFFMPMIEVDKYNYYESLVNSIPKFGSEDIMKYAEQKLTEEEKKVCLSFVKRSENMTKYDLENETSNIDSYFLKEAISAYLIAHPDSNYMFSKNVLNKNMAQANKRLAKRLRKIDYMEAIAWKHANKHYRW